MKPLISLVTLEKCRGCGCVAKEKYCGVVIRKDRSWTRSLWFPSSSGHSMILWKGALDVTCMASQFRWIYHKGTQVKPSSPHVLLSHGAGLHLRAASPATKPGILYQHGGKWQNVVTTLKWFAVGVLKNCLYHPNCWWALSVRQIQHLCSDGHRDTLSDLLEERSNRGVNYSSSFNVAFSKELGSSFQLTTGIVRNKQRSVTVTVPVQRVRDTQHWPDWP